MLTTDGTVLYNMFSVINMLKQLSPQFFFNSILKLKVYANWDFYVGENEETISSWYS